MNTARRNSLFLRWVSNPIQQNPAVHGGSIKYVYTVAVLVLDKPNFNGRIYTTETALKIIASTVCGVSVYGSLADALQPYESRAVGRATKPEIKNGALCYDVCFFDEVVQADFEAGKKAIRASGVVSVYDGTVANDFNLTDLFLTDDPA